MRTLGRTGSASRDGQTETLLYVNGVRVRACRRFLLRAHELILYYITLYYNTTPPPPPRPLHPLPYN